MSRPAILRESNIRRIGGIFHDHRNVPLTDGWKLSAQGR
jgi:hypothetical protein